jgi:hypothetical protein
MNFDAVSGDESTANAVKPKSSSSKWEWVKANPKFSIPIAVVIIGVLIVGVLMWTGTIETFAGGVFSQNGRPDWEVRNKGHMHQERSDSHVSTKKDKNKWDLSSFKKSVALLNRKANGGD